MTQKIINISHFLCQFSSENTPVRLRLASPPLRSQGAMQIQAPPFFFPLPLCFSCTPLPQPPHPIVLTTSSPSLVDYMTEPRLPSCCSYSLQGRGRNDKSYLQVTVGNSGNPRLGKIQAFFFTLFSLMAEPFVMLRGELQHSAAQS